MAEIIKDEWLSLVLGCSAFLVYGQRSEIYGIMKEAEKGFYFAKVSTDRVDILRELEQEGFRVVDTVVTLIRQPSPREHFTFPKSVREAEPQDASALLDIAGSAFCYSRFHLDPEILNETANRIKQAWLGSYLAGTRGKLLVSARNGTVTGFLAVMRETEGQWTGSKPTMVIDLIAVGRAYQGQGIGKDLVSAFISSYPEHPLKVGTQAANVPSLALYQRMGFKIVMTEYVLHLHAGLLTYISA